MLTWAITSSTVRNEDVNRTVRSVLIVNFDNNLRVQVSSDTVRMVV